MHGLQANYFRLLLIFGVGIDARGLLLFVGCYGIPKAFTNEDVWDLVRLSNSKQIADALRRSQLLVARVSGVSDAIFPEAYVNVRYICSFVEFIFCKI